MRPGSSIPPQIRAAKRRLGMSQTQPQSGGCPLEQENWLIQKESPACSLLPCSCGRQKRRKHRTLRCVPELPFLLTPGRKGLGEQSQLGPLLCTAGEEEQVGLRSPTQPCQGAQLAHTPSDWLIVPASPGPESLDVSSILGETKQELNAV